LHRPVFRNVIEILVHHMFTKSILKPLQLLYSGCESSNVLGEAKGLRVLGDSCCALLRLVMAEELVSMKVCSGTNLRVEIQTLDDYAVHGEHLSSS
jgi:hypothetical protein